MKLLLDEDVPEPLLSLLEHLLPEHLVQHVATVRWKSKKDIPLFADARRRRFHAILTNNLRQLNDPDECKAIQKSALHAIYYTLDRNVEGLALATAAICAAIRPIMLELSGVNSQRIVWIQALTKAKRYEAKNPATQFVSKYWP